MTPIEALEHALIYLEGVHESTGTDVSRDAMLILERLAKSGFVLQSRKKYDRLNLKPTEMKRRSISSGQIRAMRESFDLTIADLARKAGVAFETLAAIERGDSRPQERSVRAIMDALERAKTGVE